MTAGFSRALAAAMEQWRQNEMDTARIRALRDVIGVEQVERALRWAAVSRLTSEAYRCLCDGQKLDENLAWSDPLPFRTAADIRAVLAAIVKDT